jgi:hypothetical protein
LDIIGGDMIYFKHINDIIQGYIYISEGVIPPDDYYSCTLVEIPNEKFNRHLTCTNNTLNLVEVVIGNSEVQLSHFISDTNPANGIPEIPGDGNSVASILIQMRTGDTYSIMKTGPGEWDYEEVKIADGQLVTDNTYEGKTLGLVTTKGLLNKREVILDSNSQGSFKIKSEAKTCIENEAAVITITPKDIEGVLGTSMRLEFGPVDF